MSKLSRGFIVVDDLRLSSGESIPKAQLHYRTMGSVHRDADGAILNAVLLLHGTTGSSVQFLKEDFAKAMFGPGQPLDSRRWFIVIPDALGHGDSTKPSDGTLAEFPAYRYRDMVTAQHEVCTQLGIERLRLVLGTSMGGMHTWLWAGLYPDRLDAAVAIACEPAPITGRNLLWRTMISRAARADPGWNQGRLSPTSLGFWATWPVSNLMSSNPRRLEHVGDTAAALSQLDEWVANAPDPYDMVYALEASGDYDPRPLLPRMRAPLLWITFEDDDVNPPELHRTLDDTTSGIVHVGVPAGPHTYGHYTLTHAAVYADKVAAFLNESTRR